jgi:hypothetical protein
VFGKYAEARWKYIEVNKVSETGTVSVLGQKGG